MKILTESIKAKNIILVISDITAFMSSASAFGSDPISILDPFLASSYIQIIALSDPSSFNRTIRSNPSLMERFEIVRVETGDALALVNLIEDKVI